ncbi:MAG: PqqD family protein [Alphaproteobacteria bacterium]
MGVFESYEINEPDIVAEDFDGDTVILNLANGTYFSLGGIGHLIWANIIAGHTPDAILADIADKQPERSDGSVAFVKRMVELDLIRLRARGRPAKLTAIDADWSGGDPGIEVFDDLSELIFSDPIHDVDETAGWPNPRSRD